MTLCTRISSSASVSHSTDQSVNGVTGRVDDEIWVHRVISISKGTVWTRNQVDSGNYRFTFAGLVLRTVSLTADMALGAQDSCALLAFRVASSVREA